MSVDYDFLETYDMQLASGRSFSRDFGTDRTDAFMINETAVTEFNWDNAANALAKTIMWCLRLRNAGTSIVNWLKR